ncbi:MAG: MFS transporter [Lentisphaeria bacterium]|nr:MFS transporter [Lentisphaeria bacterium]
MQKKEIKFDGLDWAVFLGYAGYAASTAVIPLVLVPMGQDLKLNLTSGGALHLVSRCVMVISMMLAGAVSNRFGKRNILCLSILLMGIGLGVCGTAANYLILLAALVVMGFGNGFFESLATGFMQDRHQGNMAGRYINITHSFWPLGILLTGLTAGMWLQYGGRWQIFLFVLAGLLIGPVLLFRMGKEQQTRQPGLEFNWKEFGLPLKNPRFILFLLALFLTGGSEHCLTFWTPSYIASEYRGQGFICGMGVALFTAGMFIGRAGSGLLKIRLDRLIVICSVLAALLAPLIPLVHSAGLVLFLLVGLGMVIGPLWPSLQYCCVSSLKQYDSTRLYILMPLFGIPGCGICTFLLGLLGDKFGLRTGFCLVFFCNLLIAAVIALHWKLESKQGLKDEKSKNCNVDSCVRPTPGT